MTIGKDPRKIASKDVIIRCDGCGLEALTDPAGRSETLARMLNHLLDYIRCYQDGISIEFVTATRGQITYPESLSYQPRKKGAPDDRAAAEAVHLIRDAIKNPGKAPHYHHQMIRSIRNKWPTLYVAIENAINVSEDRTEKAKEL